MAWDMEGQAEGGVQGHEGCDGSCEYTHVLCCFCTQVVACCMCLLNSQHHLGTLHVLCVMFPTAALRQPTIPHLHSGCCCVGSSCCCSCVGPA
jgi:hypothetical protein